MKRKVFFTLIHKRNFIGVKQVDGFEFIINNTEFYGDVDNEKNKAYIIDPKTGRSIYDLPVFDDYQGINAIKYTVDSLKEDEHTLEAFELKRHTEKYELMEKSFDSLLHGAELEKRCKQVS